ncbi:uncharacterized protein LOC144864987 [Branchiostoma floridae x Branchiostoma japonicum]
MSENRNETTPPTTGPSEETLKSLLNPEDDRFIWFSSVYLIGKHAMLTVFYTTILIISLFYPFPEYYAAMWAAGLFGAFYSISIIMYQVYMIWDFKNLQSTRSFV